MVNLQEREHPKRYIDDAIDLVRGLSDDPMIIEIGCCRQGLDHDVDKDTCFACCDGHSTYLWARTGWRVISVDIVREHVDIARAICSNFNNIRFYNVDAIQFALSMPPAKVDLLFLDAWDVDLNGCAEKHLEFYTAIRPRLLNDPLILIDDTDLYYNHEKKEFFSDKDGLSGKGEILIPELKKEGYSVVFKGRQTLLRKK